MAPRCLQAKAVFLLAVFLSAGTTLPSLDGILFHVEGGSQRAQIHLEPAGGCPDHTQHCVLSRTAPGAGALVAVSHEVRAEAPSAPDGPFNTPPLISASIAGAPHSRAPPVPLA
jgi:hypothetical protein